ncbi:MAG: YdjY domain-containing protein [Verrucomicrobiota bacterium]
MKPSALFFKTALIAFACFAVNSPIHAEEPAKEPAKAEAKVDEKPEGKAEAEAEKLIELTQNREELIMPGMKIMVKKGYIDVDAKVCLTEGMLELIACTKDSKEHESLIMVEPKAAHIHAALLLIGAQPGNPAMRKEVQTEDGPRWVDLPPRGQEIEVYLVFNNKAGEPEEHPIKKFLIKGLDENFDGVPAKEEKKEDRAFPTHTFLFVGSHVFKDGEADPIYLADESGNVISLATFGDELLALPGVHGHENEGLVWAIDSTHLPPLDTKVILRLKPKKPVAAEQPKK